jgi:mannose-6-phosphate isomerase-like protein (cupin superfamily)
VIAFRPDAELKRLRECPLPFIELLSLPHLAIEIFAPLVTDTQQPHARDEVYFVIRGSGEFVFREQRSPFSAGDMFYVPAGAPHRFENFTSDFSAWVLFCGPDLTL